MDKTLVIGFPLNDADKLKEIAQEFSFFSKGHMTGCVLAIDGLVIKTRVPYTSEVENINAYHNRHDCFGLVVLAGCDSNLKFNLFSCCSSGSTNDSLAWEMCTLKRVLDEKLLPKKYYFIGDEAFACGPQMLSPWPGRGIGEWKDSFNYHLSSMRQCI